MNDLIEAFMKHTFGKNLLSKVNEKQKTKMIQSMMAIVFSHRIHKKDSSSSPNNSSFKKYNKPLDQFVIDSVKDELIDFGIMRDTMYHYSSGVESKFFSYHIESFYF